MDLRQTGALFRGVKVGVAKSRFKFHALATCAALMTFATTGWGQTYYDMSIGNYADTFTSLSGYPTNFNGLSTATGTIPSATALTQASTSLGTVSNSANIQNDTVNGRLLFLTTGTSDNTTSIGCDLNLNFTGRTAGSLTASLAQVANSTGSRGGTLRAYYSLNGSTWTELTGTDLPFVAQNNVTKSANISISLPQRLTIKPQSKLGFTITMVLLVERLAIDLRSAWIISVLLRLLPPRQFLA